MRQSPDTQPSPAGGRCREAADGGARQRRAARVTRDRARELRRRQTNAEAKLWWELRGRNDGLKFRRQHPVPPFILDFAEMSLKLAVELDGYTHDEVHERAYDERRTRYLEARGWTVLRFENVHSPREVLEVADAVFRVASELRSDRTPRPAGAPPSDRCRGHLPPAGEGLGRARQ